MIVEILKSHAGLDHGIRKLLIDLDDLVHPMQIECHRSGESWGGSSVADVLATGEGPHWDVVLICDLENALKLLKSRRTRLSVNLFALESQMAISRTLPDGCAWYLPVDTCFVDLIRI